MTSPVLPLLIQAELISPGGLRVAQIPLLRPAIPLPPCPRQRWSPASELGILEETVRMLERS